MRNTAMQRRRQHPADHDRAENPPRRRTRAGGRPQRDAAEDEGERRHQNRPQPEPRPLERRIDQRVPLPRGDTWRTRR